MKTEKVILSFIALLAGLLVAGVAFYFYQSTKAIPPSSVRTVTVKPPSPTPKSSIFLTIATPADEQVVANKTINITGNTIPDATVLVSTEIGDQVTTTAQNGNFQVTINLDNGENLIYITAIAPNGEEVTLIRTITYSTESF